MRPQMRFDWLDTEGILLDSVSIKPAEDDSDLQDVIYRDFTERVESAWLLIDWNSVQDYLAAQIATHKNDKTRQQISIDGFSPMTQSHKSLKQESVQDLVSQCMEIWNSSWITVPA